MLLTQHINPYYSLLGDRDGERSLAEEMHTPPITGRARKARKAPLFLELLSLMLPFFPNVRTNDVTTVIQRRQLITSRSSSGHHSWGCFIHHQLLEIQYTGIHTEAGIRLHSDNGTMSLNPRLRSPQKCFFVQGSVNTGVSAWSYWQRSVKS